LIAAYRPVDPAHLSDLLADRLVHAPLPGRALRVAARHHEHLARPDGDVTVATTFGDHDSANSANLSSMLIG